MVTLIIKVGAKRGKNDLCITVMKKICVILTHMSIMRLTETTMTLVLKKKLKISVELKAMAGVGKTVS